MSILSLSYYESDATITNRAQSINQSKFIFQVITENYNVINAVALEGLPEKHYAHLD